MNLISETKQSVFNKHWNESEEKYSSLSKDLSLVESSLNNAFINNFDMHVHGVLITYEGNMTLNDTRNTFCEIIGSRKNSTHQISVIDLTK